MSIKIVPVTESLYYRYPAEFAPQPAFVEVDLRQGTLSAEVDGDPGGMVPAEVVHGFVRRFPVPPLNAEAANRVLDEVADPAERMVAGWDEEFDGSNMTGVLDADGAAAAAEIAELLGLDEHGYLPEESVFEEADQVAEWGLEGALNGDEVTEYGITGETTDQRLGEIEADILAQLAECGEGSPAVCPGLLEHLEELRDERIARDDVVWSVVRGESPGARAVEPGPLSVDVPTEIVHWARVRGLKTSDPDVYLLVTPRDEAGEIDGEIAFTSGELPESQVAAIRAALDA